MSEKKLSPNEMKRRIESGLEKWQKKIENEITSELTPFLDGIRRSGAQSRNFKLFKEAYKHFEKKRESKMKILGVLFPTYPSPEISLDNIKDVVYTLFIYLGLIESLGNNTVDILVMLLVANGRDFHIESRHTLPRIKHAVSMEDLEKERVPLTTKLSFLEVNGIEKLTKIVDSDLRNAIAHLRFEIRKNEIYVKGKPASSIVIEGMIEMNMGIKVVETLLSQLAEERGFGPKKS